jgi:cobalt-zinc-cadmium efflux system outer membrane protein
MYKWSLVLVAVVASTPCAASNDNDRAPISLTLSAAETLLVSQNRDLIASRRVLEGAQADRLTAGQRPNPTLSLSTLSIDPRRIGAGPPWERSADTALRISQPIERGDKRYLRSAAADNNVLAANFDVDETRRQQRFLLRQTYFDLRLAQEHVSISRETVMAFRRTLDAANVRLKSGDIASADVSRISVDALRAENDLRQNTAELERARVALAYLIGLETRAANIEATDSWPELAPMPDVPGNEVLDVRPDVRAAVERANAARKAAQLMVYTGIAGKSQNQPKGRQLWPTFICRRVMESSSSARL